MLIKLIGNETEIVEHNKFIEKLKENEPNNKFIQDFEPIKCLDDVFCPYENFIEQLKEEGLEDYLYTKDTIKDTTGVYISELNYDGYLNRLTTKKLFDKIHDMKLYRSYGVCDNASQVIELYNEKVKDGKISKDDDIVIILSPIFKKTQSEWGGWRWHKWGQYIGNFDIKNEYLSEEDGIELVFVYAFEKMI